MRPSTTSTVDADRTLTFAGAEGVVVQDGRRILSFRAERSAVLTIEWNLESQMRRALWRKCLASAQLPWVDLQHLRL